MNISISGCEIIGLIASAIVVIIYSADGIKTWFVQSRCKHDEGVFETRACDAICRKCRKNLGFIGTWREKQKELTS